MRTILCAICCALPILWSPSPTYGQPDTEVLQDLIDDGGTLNTTTGRREVTIDRSYVVGPILLQSNLELILQPGVVIEAKLNAFTDAFPGYNPQNPCGPTGPYGTDYDDPGQSNKLFLARNISNLVIIGQGTPGVDQATLRMRGDVQPPEYPLCSNFVHALALIQTSDVEVFGLKIEHTGGDGINIRDGLRVNVHDCIVEGANRNGIAVVSGTDITVENCTLENSSGKSPQAGLDVEPANAADVLQNVRIRRCRAEGNNSSGFVVSVGALNSASPDVDVVFEDCTVNGGGDDGQGIGFQAISGDESGPGGLIKFVNCTAIDPGGADEDLHNHLLLKWDLRSPLRMEFTGSLKDDRPNEEDNRKLIRMDIRGQNPPQGEIVIKGTVTGVTPTGASLDPVFKVDTVNCDSCGAPPFSFPQISGCLAIGSFQDGPGAALLPNVFVRHETPDCGNGTIEACEECDDGDDDNNDGCDNSCVSTPVGPTIAAQWDGPDPENPDPQNQPVLNQNYELEGTPDSPLVRLITGHDDWRIWSVGANNSVGDIGTISTPVAQNFTVKLLRPDGTAGARNVRAISLVPTGPGNQANLADASLTGGLTESLVVKADADGNGGEVTLQSSGPITANMTIHKLKVLEAPSLSGTINITELAGGPMDDEGRIDIDGEFLGDLTVGTVTGGNASMSLYEIGGSASAVVEGVQGGVFTVESVKMAAGSSLHVVGPIAGQLEMEIGQSPSDPMAGIILLSEIPYGSSVTIAGKMTGGATGGVLHLFTPLEGNLILTGGADGDAEIHGSAVTVTGYLGLGYGGGSLGPATQFSGWATILGPVSGLIDTRGTVTGDAGCGSFPGTLEIIGSAGSVEKTGTISLGEMPQSSYLGVSGDVRGTLTIEDCDAASTKGVITIDGDLTGPAQFNGVFAGVLCAANLSGTEPLPPNVQISVGPGATVCSVDAQGFARHAWKPTRAAPSRLTPRRSRPMRSTKAASHPLRRAIHWFQWQSPCGSRLSIIRRARTKTSSPTSKAATAT